MRRLLATAFLAVVFLSSLSKAAGPGQKLEIKPPKVAVALLTPTQGNDVRGVIRLTQTKNGVVHLAGTVRGLSPGKHGFHIHEFGDLRAADGSSSGAHYNPRGLKHGGPDDRQHHPGDLGNLVANEEGVAVVNNKTKTTSSCTWWLAEPSWCMARPTI